MRKLLSPILLTAIAASAAFAGSSSISWKKAYPSATAEAKSSGKLIMVDFYTDWCGWCKKLDSDTYPDPQVVAQSEKFVSVKLNAEKDPDGIRLAKKFKVTGFPTILFLDADENLAYKVVGYEPAAAFADSMKKASTIRQDLAKYRTALKTNPNDFSALVGLAGVEATMGNVDSAANEVDKAAKSASAANKGKLLDACNAVGDGYQNAGQFDKAIPFFKRAIDTGFPTQSAYARISIAVCLAESGKLTEAKPYLQDLLKMTGAPNEYTDQAKQMLDAITKQGK